MSYEHFFQEIVPRLALGEVGRRCQEPLVLGFVLRGAPTPVWTVSFGPLGAEAQPGSAALRPLFTVVTEARDWDIAEPRLVAWADRLADQAGKDHVILPEDIDRVAKLGGGVRLVATDYVDVEGQTRDLVSELWIGSWEAPDVASKTFSVTVTAGDYAGLLDGSVRPAAAFAEGRIQIGGNIGHAMRFGMAAMRLRPKKGSR